jgi:hypothetical protein
VDEDPVDAVDAAIVFEDRARIGQARTKGAEVRDDEPRVRLARRSERSLDADVELWAPARNQQPPRPRIASGFGSSSIPSSAP